MIQPEQKKEFAEIFDNLQSQIDVDASDGRSVPNNMNFTDTDFLTKDTGFILAGKSEDVKCHSLFLYKKKDGTSYFIRGKGTKLQTYNFSDRIWSDIPGGPTFTEDAEFGWAVYDDNLYGSNAVENYFKFNGSTFTEYASAPKGNILEIFEDRMFVSGTTDEPLSVYYSKVSDPTDFTVSSSAGGVIKPLGTDFVRNLKNYYGILMIFKDQTIWKLTFTYDQIVSLFVPKLELQSGNYGTCSRKSVSWVENDLWFFTGTEVRSIGYKDNQTGVLGVNASVISNSIKETLKLISPSNYLQSVCFYFNRRFYLSVPITESTTDNTFVCHLLYKNSWTKYTGRDKAKLNDLVVIDDIIYSTSSSPPFGVIKWTVEDADKEDINNTLTTES